MVDAKENGWSVGCDADFDGCEMVGDVSPGAELENSWWCEEKPDSEAELDGEERKEMELGVVGR